MEKSKVKVDRAGLIGYLVNLQTTFNNETNGDVWVTGVTQEGREIDWVLCMAMELMEAIDSTTAWKHWKSLDLPADMDNVKIEVVDVFHFLISYCIVNDGLDILSGEIGDDELLAESISKMSVLDTLKELLNLTMLLNYVTGENETRLLLSDLVQVFMMLLDKIDGFSLEEAYKLYIGKNALNKLRQSNNYKGLPDNGPAYVKSWDGSEDNVWLTNYMNTEGVDVSYEGTYEALSDKYAEVVRSL